MSRVMKTLERMNRLGIAGLLVSLLLFSLSNESILGHDDNAYCHDSNIGTIGISKVDWMRRVPDDVHISEMSIPGTHETMALYGIGDVGNCQTASLRKQLDAGIRALDIRCRHVSNVFHIYHHMLSQYTNFGAVLDTCEAFLAAHPSETILMRVKPEHTEITPPLNCSRSFADTFGVYYTLPVFWKPDGSDNPKDATLGEVRGKIVVSQDEFEGKYGIKWKSENTDIQDEYIVPTNWDIYDKWEKVKKHLNAANDAYSEKIFINFLSGVSPAPLFAPYPYTVASGHSSPGTGDPRLWTGLVDGISAESSDYPDFPRVDCWKICTPPIYIPFKGWISYCHEMCFIAFEGTNTLTKQYIEKGYLKRRVGIVMADFPGKGLIEAIVRVNEAIGLNPLNQPPVAHANGPYKGYEGSAITYDASKSTDPDGDPLQYCWDFDNDGVWDIHSTSPKVDYTHFDDYSSDVKLQVSDGYLTDIATASVTVNNVAPLVNAGSDSTVNEGQRFTQIACFTDPAWYPPLKIYDDTLADTVNYGDGTGQQQAISYLSTSCVGVRLSHVYADNGSYTVTVTATDEDGGSGSDTITVTVNNVAPTVVAGSDRTVDEGETLTLAPSTFNDKGTLDTHTATIDWGDGSPVENGTVTESPSGPPGSTAGADGTAAFGTHEYGDNGTYTVTVTVADDDGGVGSDTLTVTVNNVAPTVAAGPDRTVAEGETLTLAPSTFNDKGTLDTHTATIDWGDGSPVENGTVAESPSGPPGSTAGADGTAAFGGHEYGDNGTYMVTVTVTDDDGGAGSDTLIVTVNNVAPTAKIDDYTSPVEGSILPGQEVTFDGSFTDPGWLDLHTSQWNFGDGSIVAGTLTEENDKPDATGTVSDKHIYADPGTYTVVLEITDDDGGIGTDQTEVKVMTASEAIDFANNYIQNLEEDSFRGQAEQRKQAFSNKFEAVKNAIAADALVGAINNLRNDIRSKADGSVDGKSQDDWVTDKEAQSMICLMIDELVKYLESLQEEKDKPMVAKAENEDKDKAEAAPAAQRMLPERTRLLACFPNPGNPEVWIPYQLSADSQVTIRIYDVTGRLVRTLDLGHKPSGFYDSRSKAAYWDGSNEAGERVASGIYFYNLQAGNFAATRKLIIKK